MREQRQESDWTLNCQMSFKANIRMDQGSALLPFLFFLILVDLRPRLILSLN